MERIALVVTLIGCVVLVAGAQSPDASSGPGKAVEPAPAPSPDPSIGSADTYSVIERGPHHRVWERLEYEPAPDGRQIPRPHRYVELATGLHYWDGSQWKESQELIEAYPGGAVARHGQHKVIFAYNLATLGAIDMELPDGKRLRSHVLGLAYFDTASGKNVLVAGVKDCTGVIVEPNQVLYADAFDGLRADVRYTYTRAGFEQDIILHERPLGPEAYGLNPATTRLQVWTEFVQAPKPVKARRAVQLAKGHQVADETLDFGSMQIGSGKAFTLGEGSDLVSAGARRVGIGNALGHVSQPGVGMGGSPSRPMGEAAALEALQPGRGVPVGKQWVELEWRRFLVEEVPVDAVAEELESLPQTTAPIAKAKPVSTAQLISSLPVLPEQGQQADNAAKPMQLASVGAALLPAQALVLDYVTLNSTWTNYTFRGDTTYYISGPVNLYGTNIFEGGTVIKYARNVGLAINPGPPGTSPAIRFETGPYRPVVFTAVDDDSVGERITGSTGNPTGYYASTALNLGGLPPQLIANARFLFCRTAIGLAGSTHDIQNAQFVNCSVGFSVDGAAINLRNALFANVLTNFAILGDVVAQHVTFNSSLYLSSLQGTVRLTNCIVANVTNLTNGVTQLTGSHNGFYNSPQFGENRFISPVYPFQTVGGGSYYLVDGAGFRNVGTTNINTSLLAELRKKTTYPPIVHSNVTFTTDTVFSPQAQRDTDTPDLGYHYEPLDYVFGGVKALSNLTFTAGTAAGWFQLPGSGGPGYGIYVTNGMRCTINGTATEPCYMVRYSTVMEGCNGLWKDKGWLAFITGQGRDWPAPPARLVARFTVFSHLAWDPGHFRDYYAPLQIELNHCQLLGSFGGYGMIGFYTNCLIDCCDFWQGTSATWAQANFRNCTFRRGSFTIVHWEAGAPYWYSSIRECAFDGTPINIQAPFGYNLAYADYDYNAYTNLSNPFPSGYGANDVRGVSFNWQSGPLGNFYLPANSPLIDAGSCTADQVGLYHFTTRTSQLKETNSIVDIGYHYVALDANGNPIDTDGDGLPDYWEDWNGNGSGGDDFTSWLVYDSANGLSPASGLIVFTPLK